MKMDKTTKSIIIIAFLLVIIWGSVYYIIKTKNEREAEQFKVYSNFTRTYNVLNVAPSNDENYIYLTIRGFQEEEVVTVKVNKNLNKNIEENKTYEFVFDYEGKKLKDKVEVIFKEMNLKMIKETDKVGFEQINDSL